MALKKIKKAGFLETRFLCLLESPYLFTGVRRI